MAFTHLHVHTEYSGLDGMIRIKDLFRVAGEMGQEAVAITDHGNLGAMWAAQEQATATGVKLIPGEEFYLANGTRFSKIPFMVPTEDNSTDEDSVRGDEDGGTVEFVVDTANNRKARPYQHLTVLARNAAGWRNLVILNNEAQNSIWHKPRIDFALLKAHAEGIIVLTGCLGGPVVGPLSHAAIAEIEATATEEAFAAAELAHADALALIPDVDVDARAELAEDQERTITNLRRKAFALHQEAAEYRADAARNIEALIDAVGAENVYVEVMDHGIAEESRVMADVVALARTYNLPIVATNDAHHTHEDDAHAQSAWLLVQSKSTIARPKFQFHGAGYWLKTETEMRAVRPEPWWQEACDTTQLIADRVDAQIIPGHRDLLPKFPTPDGFASNREFMYHLLRDGARSIYGGISKRIRDRIRTEMEVIEESGYIDYFLVVHDLIAWCVRNGILVGPGRGSAGGSLVAYLMGITRVDPLRYNLLFERFLERGRQEPPDIDIDFPQSRRDDVINYLRERWGEDKVAFIGTFNIARSRAAIKDAARVLGQGTVGNKMAALVPLVGATPMGMDEMMAPDQAAAAEYRKYIDSTDPIDERGRPDEDGIPAGRRIHDLAASFENVVKGAGLHASGIIVSAEKLFDIVPMRMTKRGWALQWTGPEAEKVGLLKVDVLGLRNLDIVAKAVEYIAQTTGEQIDPLALPDPDQPSPQDAARVQNAWKVIGEGRTEGLFQLESPKMTELAQDVAPHSLNDLSALVALFRPGPMGKGLHTEYAARKRNPTLVSYRDYTTDPAEQEALTTVFGDTYGLFVYQEQVMMLGTVVAGFDAAGRSTLRKAVSKKKRDVMEVVGGKFRDGAPREHRDADGNVISIPFSETTTNALWDASVSFAEYAFNRSHSATYGYLAYITAFLKGNWPVEFAAATLAVTSGTDKRLQVLRSLRREGIDVLAPDVNAGNADTAPAGPSTIRIGLSEVKGLKEAGVRIAEERNDSGIEFESIRDLYLRVLKPATGDSDGRGSAITSAHVRALIEAGAMDAWCDGNRLGLLAVSHAAKGADIPALPMEWGTLERSSRQRDALGLIVGTHPLTALQDQVKAYRPVESSKWDTRGSIAVVPISRVPEQDGAQVTTIGVLAGWSEKAYSKGRMAAILIEGSTVSIAGTMWDRELSEHTDADLIPNVGEIVAVTGRVRFRTIASDTDDEDAQEQVVKELQISKVRRVDIREDARDSWPNGPQVRVPILARDAFGYEADVMAAEEAAAAAPVVETAEDQLPFDILYGEPAYPEDPQFPDAPPEDPTDPDGAPAPAVEEPTEDVAETADVEAERLAPVTSLVDRLGTQKGATPADDAAPVSGNEDSEWVDTDGRWFTADATWMVTEEPDGAPEGFQIGVPGSGWFRLYRSLVNASGLPDEAAKALAEKVDQIRAARGVKSMTFRAVFRAETTCYVTIGSAVLATTKKREPALA